MSAAERREQILQVALSEFAVKGLHGTSTETIAQRAGVSQPYLFRLFGTKKDLFLAVVERGFDLTEAAFQRGAEREPDNVLEAIGHEYMELLALREVLLIQMQCYAACSDPEVRAVVRKRYGELYRYARQVSGASEQELMEFFATGMLLNVVAAMDLPSAFDSETWACDLLAPLEVAQS
jgi:AcrR family transcriptional regulator